MLATITVTVLFLLIASGLCLLLKKMAPKSASAPVEAPEGYSARRYDPMQRLLDDSAEAFVSDPAFSKSQINKIRSERRSIFRGYLRCISRDHGTICSSIRSIMIASNVDRPDLAKALTRSELFFVGARFAIEYRLFLHFMGWGTVDVRDLVTAFKS